MAMEALIAAIAALSPEEKIALFKGLGMSRVGDNHQPDCGPPAETGIRCNCVPPASSWSHPEDVEVFLKETWEDRLERAKKREAYYESKGI
jgi:hypothetical protein